MEQAQFYGVRPMGKRNLEWDLNDWKWDGDLFIASPSDPASVKPGFRGQQIAGQSSNSSSSISDDLRGEPEIVRGQTGDLDRKRRVIVVDNDHGEDEETGTLSLKLAGYSSSGGQSQVGIEGSGDGSGDKKIKLTGSPPNRAVCQVENCGLDLSNAKDYHRRHKVCEMHSKASEAVVGNVIQRFCQQCSRFHLLQEFDEGKRSCRRRLAGHNKRRRKTQPEPAVGLQPVNDEQASNYVLVSLLKLLSNVHADNRPDPSTDHNLVAHLVRSLERQSGSQNVNNVSGLLHEYQKNSMNGTISIGNSEKCLPPRPAKPTDQHCSMPPSEMPQEKRASSQKSDIVLSKDGLPVFSEVQNSVPAQTKLNNFDLNDVYVDLDDGVEDSERSPVTVTGAFRMESLDRPSWAQQDSQQSSPPVSGNSDSASAQSPSSSSGEAQSRTGRLVFKLFGKEPNDFPIMLRGQILDWLAHSPTDLESYIRAGCVILTIYLRLPEPIWEELSLNLGFSLSRLLDITDDSFWGTGWLYTRVQNQIAFCHNGVVVINTSLPSKNSYRSRILSVSPIAVSMSEQAQFQIKGSNLSRPSTRLICALEGQCLAQEVRSDLITDDDNIMDDDEIECVNMCCSIPSVTGRGFIEVEDDDLSNSFFPFIVAEKDVCSEIRTLESLLESGDSNEANEKWDAKNQATDFLHEMGWLLHRCQLKSRLIGQNLNADVFPFKRFRGLMEFSMDHDWCAVVKKLLGIFLQGTVDAAGEHPSLDVALSEMGLLHRAVRRNSRPLVELLLHYAPVGLSEESGYERKLPSNGDGRNCLFVPDAKGPAGLTPLHIAAGKDGSEAVLDALTDDPGKVGVEAWRNARDSTGSTPEDYARLRGHYAYIHLVQRKTSMRPPANVPDSSKRASGGISGLEILASRNAGPSCNLCERKAAYGSVGRSLVYRPAMLSMVGIAAVCVCVALLFRGLPDVDCIFKPFRWESLDYGSI